MARIEADSLVARTLLKTTDLSALSAYNSFTNNPAQVGNEALEDLINLYHRLEAEETLLFGNRQDFIKQLNDLDTKLKNDPIVKLVIGGTSDNLVRRHINKIESTTTELVRNKLQKILLSFVNSPQFQPKIDKDGLEKIDTTTFSQGLVNYLNSFFQKKGPIIISAQSGGSRIYSYDADNRALFKTTGPTQAKANKDDATITEITFSVERLVNILMQDSLPAPATVDDIVSRIQSDNVVTSVFGRVGVTEAIDYIAEILASKPMQNARLITKPTDNDLINSPELISIPDGIDDKLMKHYLAVIINHFYPNISISQWETWGAAAAVNSNKSTWYGWYLEAAMDYITETYFTSLGVNGMQAGHSKDLITKQDLSFDYVWNRGLNSIGIQVKNYSPSSIKGQTYFTFKYEGMASNFLKNRAQLPDELIDDIIDFLGANIYRTNKWSNGSFNAKFNLLTQVLTARAPYIMFIDRQNQVFDESAFKKQNNLVSVWLIGNNLILSSEIVLSVIETLADFLVTSTTSRVTNLITIAFPDVDSEIHFSKESYKLSENELNQTLRTIGSKQPIKASISLHIDGLLSQSIINNSLIR